MIPDWEANQDSWELGMAMSVLEATIEPIDTVLEIGVQYAGSFRAWSEIASPNALLIGVDVANADLPHRANQTATMITMSSPQAKDHVLRTLNGRAVDFLFIDGDHAYASVAADFEAFAPLVRKGGGIGLHDIRWDQVAVFWGELKERYSNQVEIHNRRIGQSPPDMRCYMGIGIIYP